MKQAQITAEYIDHSGSDLMVVNAARASFGKESSWAPSSLPEEDSGRKLKQADASLIRFLATGYRTSEWEDFLIQVEGTVVNGTAKDLTDLLHTYKRKAQHFAPFAHPHLTIRMSLPIFLARQFVKHQIGGTWGEESRRYISNEPDVWFPNEWHTRPEDVKQGSGEPAMYQLLSEETSRTSTQRSLISYQNLLEQGVAPEEARIVLPLNMMTTVVWTGSLLFWSRVYNQRTDSHAQLAAQELAALIGAIVEPHYPVSWAALTT